MTQDQKTEIKNKEVFQKLFDHIADSWNAGNRNSYVNVYNESSVYMVPNGELRIGNEAIKEFVFSFPDTKQGYTIVEVIGNTELAVVRGSYSLHTPDGNQMDKGKFLTVFTLAPGGNWIQTHGIWNSDLPVPGQE